jgi:hypothetical protein
VVLTGAGAPGRSPGALGVHCPCQAGGQLTVVACRVYAHASQVSWTELFYDVSVGQRCGGGRAGRHGMAAQHQQRERVAQQGQHFSSGGQGAMHSSPRSSWRGRCRCGPSQRAEPLCAPQHLGRCKCWFGPCGGCAVCAPHGEAGEAGASHGRRHTMAGAHCPEHLSSSLQLFYVAALINTTHLLLAHPDASGLGQFALYYSIC